MRIGVLPADGLVLAEEAAIRRREVALRSEEVRKSLLREEDNHSRTA
jgi:hypothetical protein